jgi:hypothetical protein
MTKGNINDGLAYYKIWDYPRRLIAAKVTINELASSWTTTFGSSTTAVDGP